MLSLKISLLLLLILFMAACEMTSISTPVPGSSPTLIPTKEVVTLQSVISLREFAIRSLKRLEREIVRLKYVDSISPSLEIARKIGDIRSRELVLIAFLVELDAWIERYQLSRADADSETGTLQKGFLIGINSR